MEQKDRARKEERAMEKGWQRKGKKKDRENEEEGRGKHDFPHSLRPAMLKTLRCGGANKQNSVFSREVCTRWNDKQNSVFWREVCTRWYLGREARETPCECVVKELFVVCCLLHARRDGSSSPELPDGVAP